MEEERVTSRYFQLIHDQLSRKIYSGQFQQQKMDVKFLTTFCLCLEAWDYTADEERMERSRSIIAPLLKCLAETWPIDIHDFRPTVLDLDAKIQQSKQSLEGWWLKSFHWSFRCKPSPSFKILKFLDIILDNLYDLVNHKAGEIVPFKKQTETLEEMLEFLKNFMQLTKNSTHGVELGEFNMFVQVFANDAACLTCLYWATTANDQIPSETNSMLSHMMKKIKSTTPHIARFYFGTLETICMQQSDSVLFRQTVSSFIHLFLDDPVTPLKGDFQILRDDIVFLLTFLHDPSNNNAKELYFNQSDAFFFLKKKIDALFWEDLCGLLPFDDIEADLSKKKVFLSDFMMKVASVNANIRKTYIKFPDSSLYKFPTVIPPLFLDFLVQNLRNLKERMISDRKYLPCAKYKIIQMEEGLVSLCPLFDHFFDLQSELHETWLEVVSLVHRTDLVISTWISSWFITDHPIWYHMVYLSDVHDEIKVVTTKLEKIKENTMFTARCLPRSDGLISTLSKQARPSNNEMVVGFEDEVENIIDKLIWGHKSLDIVSIVGMGGLGKTTLAKKVYGSLSVKSNFHVSAFCSVSQDHNIIRLLHDILNDVDGGDDEICDMTEDDLAHRLWKSLSRQKYLIVLDDIWNESAWNKVKSSFPDDKNGSRVMLTTRSRNVADKCKINCSPHQLRFLNEIESWELLQKKVFYNDISPPYLCETGKMIAKNCKGLPLTIVVIAGLLAREKTQRWWSEVAEKLVSYLSDKGCMKILELSYKHLPENLKPCLLYLGVFPEDRLIKVKNVILLWIAEGFVQESQTKSIEDVAKDYLHDLADRSLIIVGAKSYNDEIKAFRVHDMIRELCQSKCRDRNFFHQNYGIASGRSLHPSRNNYYRVSIQKKGDVTIAAGSSLSNARSLLFFSGESGGYCNFPFGKFGLVRVLNLESIWRGHDVEQLSSLVHLRHIRACLLLKSLYIPLSISNIWNIGSLVLSSRRTRNIHMPKTFWRMKSLRHVKVDRCILEFSDGSEKLDAYPKLDRVVSFSKPFVSTGEDVQRLLERLPAVRELSCILEGYYEKSTETLDFDRKLESLKLTRGQATRKRSPNLYYLINFPSTLKKLTLVEIMLPLMAISLIAELHCLQVLKLRWISFLEPRLEMEDLAFENLIFFELRCRNLVEWNATVESLPNLEQLVIECEKLEDLPPSFEEISTFKRIVVENSPEVVESSALRIRKEQMELGNKVEVSIRNANGIFEHGFDDDI